MMDCKKALERDRRRPRGRQGLAAQEGPRRRGEARRSRRRAGRGRRRRRRQRRPRSSSSTARPTSSPRAPTSSRLVGRAREARRRQGDDASTRQPFEGATVGETVTQLAAKLGENDRARARRRASRPTDGSLDGYKHIQNERGTIGVLVELGGVDPSTRRPGRSRTTSRSTSRRRRPRYVTPRRRARRRAREGARGARGADPQRGQARAGDRRRSSRAGSTASTRTTSCSSRAFVRDPKITIAKLLEALGADADGPPVRPGQGRRGIGSSDATGSADDREPVPPSGAEALG